MKQTQRESYMIAAPCSASLHRQVKIASATEGLSVSAWLRNIIERELKTADHADKLEALAKHCFS